jgi:perosamine synthetase
MFQSFVNFVGELYNFKSEIIPLHEPFFAGNEKKYLTECIDSGYVSSIGKFVEQFENSISSYLGAQYAIATVSGTSALHIALIISNIKPGDEVILQPLTYISTANAVSYCQAYPVFIDVDSDTLGLSAEKLYDFLIHETKMMRDGYCYNKRTGNRVYACVPMHTFGNPVKIDEISKICNKYNITLIEDAAESIGSTFRGKYTGTFGKLGILSFNGNKTITTGGGGIILTDNKELAFQAKHLTTQAKIAHPWEYVHDNIGFNYRLPNINAALGCAQMENLEYIIRKKRELAEKYYEFFKTTDFHFYTEPANTRSNYWLNTLILKDKKQRDEFLKYTNDNRIMTRPVWRLINKLAMYKNCQVLNIENALHLEEIVVNIPSSVIS